MKYSETRAEVFKALIFAKKEIEPLIAKTTTEYKTKKGEKIKFSYAELAHIYQTIDDCLTKNEATVMHDTFTKDRQNHCNTLIIHSSGEFIESGYLFYDEARDNYGAPDLRGNNGMFTTLRRISLLATMGIAADVEPASIKPLPTYITGVKTFEEAPPVNSEEPPQEEPTESFTEDIKKTIIWTEPNKQAKIYRLLFEIAEKHKINDEHIFPRLQELYNTHYDLDHMPDRAADKYIAILETTLSSGKNPLMKTKEEWGHKNESQDRTTKFLQEK